MKGIKKMLLGIALLIVATIGTIFWMAGTWVGVVLFFVGLLPGIFLVLDGYLSIEK